MHTPFILVIFGGTGDLAKNRLIPALFSLYKKQQLPEDFYIIGFSRRPFTNKEYATLFGKLTADSQWTSFSEKHLSYQQGMFNEENGYQELITKLQAIDNSYNACITRIFYLATPPPNYAAILRMLDITKLSEGCGQGSSKFTRVAIEKPFGKDLKTAIGLDKMLAEIFEEKQIFRVDHYLGKETVQNMLIFRFANNIFEPVWNNSYIDHVQITFSERKGIEGRGKFFDGVGILRDVGQNHLMQLLAAVAMEMPISFSREGVREARATAIKALRVLSSGDIAKNVVRGQFQGYAHEKGVLPNSKTETYVALKAFVDTPRFADVPFYIRAGKGMAENLVTVSLIFKQTCHILFKEIGCPEEGNILTFQIQPNEGIKIKTIAKRPGSQLMLGTVDMHFFYEEAFHTKGVAAYEKILIDIFKGDQMLFNRSDELESSWKFIQAILEGWEKEVTPLIEYEKGTWGPKEANQLIERDGRNWL